MLVLEDNLSEGYLSRFQISLSTLYKFNYDKKVRRVEIFVITSLLYEIIFERKSFKKLIDNEV